MDKTSKIIILDILEFIYRKGGDFKTWHIVVTNDPHQRLVGELQLDYLNDVWMYGIAASAGEALQVQAYFLEFGLAEGEERWQPDFCAGYAYRKHTELFIKARRKAGACSIGRSCDSVPCLLWKQKNDRSYRSSN